MSFTEDDSVVGVSDERDHTLTPTIELYRVGNGNLLAIIDPFSIHVLLSSQTSMNNLLIVNMNLRKLQVECE